jgi:hypothetical protein
VKLARIFTAGFLFTLPVASGRAVDSCDPIRTFADNKQPAREIFVSPAGSNSSGDGSPSSPFQTITRALQHVRPGDAIRLLPGVHAPGTSLRGTAGRSDAPVWLGGVAGEARPTIKGGSVGIQLSKVRYLVLENIEIIGATGNGINCDDGGEYANSNATRHLVCRNVAIRDIGTGRNNDGLKLSGVNDYFVLDCEFTRMSAGGSGIDQVGCHQGVIARCTFADAQGHGGNAIQCKGGSEDIEIRQNRFINAGGRAINIGGSTGFQFFRPPLSTNAPNFEAKNIRVVANLFRGSDAPTAFVGAVESLVANNTIIEPRRWVLRILHETVSKDGYAFLPSGQSEFVNNILYFDRSQISTPVNVGANTDAASFHFAHNLWYAINQPRQSRPSLPTAETAGIYGMHPKFSNPAGTDFTLTSDSPAIGKGRRLVKADLLGRCFADPPAIGAFQVK